MQPVFVPQRKLKQGNRDTSDEVGRKVILGRQSQWQRSGHLNEKRTELGEEAEEEAGTETPLLMLWLLCPQPLVSLLMLYTRVCLPSPLPVPVALRWQTDLGCWNCFSSTLSAGGAGVSISLGGRP